MSNISIAALPLALERRFELADTIKVVNAAFENGLLHVELVREVPEAKSRARSRSRPAPWWPPPISFLRPASFRPRRSNTAPPDPAPPALVGGAEKRRATHWVARPFVMPSLLDLHGDHVCMACVNPSR